MIVSVPVLVLAGIVVLAMNRPHRMNAIGKLFASQVRPNPPTLH